MADFIEIDIQGFRRAMLAIDNIGDRSAHGIRNWLEGMGNYAVYWLRLYAPIGETGGILRRIGHTKARWRPGGAGGGGEWEVIAGVRRTPEGPYPLYVSGGTGRYRPIAPDYIRARPGKVMTFEKRGEPRRFKTYSKGQRSQPFLYMSYQQVLLYANARVHLLGKELLD